MRFCHISVAVKRDRRNPVRDCGEGIPLSQQDLIFEPFYRIDPSRTRMTGGTGLGLTIVKTLVERMGGTLLINSQPGMGSTFTLTLPMLETRPEQANLHF